jgi:hypothetical protein
MSEKRTPYKEQRTLEIGKEIHQLIIENAPGNINNNSLYPEIFVRQKSSANTVITDEGRNFSKKIVEQIVDEYGDICTRKEILAALKEAYTYSVGSDELQNQIHFRIIASIRAHLVFKHNVVPKGSFVREIDLNELPIHQDQELFLLARELSIDLHNLLSSKDEHSKLHFYKNFKKKYGYLGRERALELFDEAYKMNANDKGMFSQNYNQQIAQLAAYFKELTLFSKDKHWEKWSDLPKIKTFTDEKDLPGQPTTDIITSEKNLRKIEIDPDSSKNWFYFALFLGIIGLTGLLSLQMNINPTQDIISVEPTDETINNSDNQALAGAMEATSTSQPSNNPTETLLPPTATELPSDTPQPTATNTLVPTATDTEIPSQTPTNTPSRTPIPPTATFTDEPTVTPTETNTPDPTATNTFVPTATNTELPTETQELTATFTSSPTSIPPSKTPEPTATNTFVPTATNTQIPTVVPTNTEIPNTPFPTPTPEILETPDALLNQEVTFYASPSLNSEQLAYLENVDVSFQNELLNNENISLSIRRYDSNGGLEYAFENNSEELFPVASTIKMFIGLYYFSNVPQEYWSAGEGSDVYRMVVYSNNLTTGNVLAEVAQYVEGDGNPIEKFNDFLHSIGVSEASGLYRWNDGALEGDTLFTDETYSPENLEVEHDIHNNFTTLDLLNGTYYIANAENNPRWNEDTSFRQSILAVRSLLSIRPDSYRSPIESVFSKNDNSWGKDGYLTPNDVGHYAISDVMVLPYEDGGFSVISLMSLDESAGNIRGILGNIIPQVNMLELQRSNTDSIEVYSNQNNADLLRYEQYNYGFVIPQNIELFLEPNENSEQIENNYRADSTLPNSYLMQGALIRVLPVNDEWAEIIMDDDIEFEYEGHSPYVRISDLELVNPEIATGIDYINPENAGLPKTVVVDMSTNELILLEGSEVVLRSPVAINDNLTQPGIFTMGRRFFSNNMSGYPGVPFAGYFDGPRAIHGSPWQRWSDTVNISNIASRSSGGCVNVPNWQISLENLNDPVRTDQLIFSWLGGQESPENNISEPVSETITIYVVENIDNLTNYNNWQFRENNITWTQVTENIESAPINAPQSYFEGSSQSVEVIDSTEEWAEIENQTTLYARVTAQNASMYTEPSYDSEQITNSLVASAVPASIYPERRYLLPQNGFVRVIKVDDEWAQLVVESNDIHPYGDRYQDVFIPLTELLPQANPETISVHENVSNDDKTVVIIRGQNPEMLLIEGTDDGAEIVMRVPVFLGGDYGNSTTPAGEYRISRMRVASDMPGFPAVGYAAYFENSQGFALHSGQFDWPDVVAGGYGTAGCVNIPNAAWRLFEFNGRNYSPDEFLYNWVLTDSLVYDASETDESHIPVSDSAYQNDTVRVITVDSVENLNNFVELPGTDWQSVIDQYNSLSSPTEWILPTDSQ